MTDSIAEFLEVLRKEERDRSAQFLKTWKIAVNMVGPMFFNVTSSSVEAAVSISELRPDMAAIKQHLLNNDGPVHQFLYMVVSFYSFMEIEDIFHSTGHMLPRVIDLQFLSDTERMIIYALVEHSEIDEQW